MKKVFIFILIILIIVILATLFLRKGQKTENIPTPTPKIAVSTITPFLTPAGNKMQINNVSFNNFYQEDTQKNPQGDASVVDNKDYQIVYLPQFKQFLITILNSDFDKTKVTAETDFLKQLGITEAEACKLSVSISTPLFVNEDLSGQIFPLSFCQ